MGENEQGGMLRTVVVVGLVALIAAVAVALVIGLKSGVKSSTLVAVDAGRNILDLKNESIKQSVKVLNDDKLNSISIVDNGDNDATLTLRPTSWHQGIYFMGKDVTSNYIDVGSKWEMLMDMKVSNPSVLTLYELGLEGSNFTGKLQPLSTEWTHYTMTGTRIRRGGTAVIYFKNTSSSPITVDVKNVELHRVK